MNFTLPLLIRCSAIALSLALLQGCDSQNMSSTYDTPSQSNTDGNQLVGLVLPASGVDEGNADGTEHTDTGDSGQATPDSPEGGNSLGVSSRQLAAETLQYVATHANLALFVQGLANSTNAYGYYDCAKGGTVHYAAVARTSDRAVLGWQFSQCVLSDDQGGDVSYSGDLTISCERPERTSGGRNCSVSFSDLSTHYSGRTSVFNGQLAQLNESASLRSESTDMATVTDGVRWTSVSQTIASEAREIRGLTTALISNRELEFNALGDSGYRQSGDGCLQAGTVLLKHTHSESRVHILAQSGGNMLINDNGVSDSLACDELHALPFTALVLR